MKEAKHISDKYHPTLKQIFETQLWSSFVALKLQNRQASELLFFDEHIIAKKNRSTRETVKASVSNNKQETPFLSNTIDEVSFEIYNYQFINEVDGLT